MTHVVWTYYIRSSCLDLSVKNTMYSLFSLFYFPQFWDLNYIILKFLKPQIPILRPQYLLGMPRVFIICIWFVVFNPEWLFINFLVSDIVQMALCFFLYPSTNNVSFSLFSLASHFCSRMGQNVIIWRIINLWPYFSSFLPRALC